VTESSEELRKERLSAEIIQVRPRSDGDLDFLYRVYASTRLEELAATGWDETEIETFLRMQFELQHTQYVQNYPEASFDIVLIDGAPAGRLYVHRGGSGIRIMDIALLPEFRGKGTGGRIIRELVREADAAGLTMSLHVEVNNPVREFYRKLGFKEIESRGAYYYMERKADGRGKDA